ncbi:MAG: hypothetical protein ACYDDO_13305 [Acidiferrobacterales bacterium]
MSRNGRQTVVVIDATHRDRLAPHSGSPAAFCAASPLRGSGTTAWFGRFLLRNIFRQG